MRKQSLLCEMGKKCDKNKEIAYFVKLGYKVHGDTGLFSLMKVITSVLTCLFCKEQEERKKEGR